MNEPEYFLEDEMETLVGKVATALSIDINYQYGYLDEVRTILALDSKTKEFEAKKYPLVWLMPSKIKRGQTGVYGVVNPFSILIIQQSNIQDRYKTRMAGTFKQVIFPIYREILKQLTISTVFLWGNATGLKGINTLEHEISKMPYWGVDQQKVINDVFDCMEVTFNNLKITNNKNCAIFSNF